MRAQKSRGAKAQEDARILTEGEPDWNPSKVRMSHKVLGALKQTAAATERRRVDKKQDHRQETTEGVMDARTRQMLFRWQQADVISALHGCLSTGKEANVYHGTAGGAAETLE